MGESANREGLGASSRVAFPCNLADARSGVRSLREFLSGVGVGEDELFAYELCLVEACNNAVQNADAAGQNQPVLAEVSCQPDRVELRVTDHTPGFTWPDRLEVPSLERERGRGLFIIRSMMDEVAYERGSAENTLIMRKGRGPRDPAPVAAPSRPSPPPDALDDVRAQLADCRRAINGMARELCFRSESLSAIFRCAAELGRTSDLAAFARRLLDDLLHLTSADWFVLRLIPPQESQLVVFAASNPALGSASLALPVSAGRTTPAPPGAEAASETGLPVPCAELAAVMARNAVRFDTGSSPDSNEPLRSAGASSRGLVQPVLFGDTLVGTLAIGRGATEEVFSGLEAEVIRTFSEFLAIQIVNLRQREEQVHNRLVTHELEIAHSIQRSLIPASLPRISGFDLAGSWESARQVGGDFYDAIALSEHTVLLVVGDVMGKGVPAAMFATIMRGLVRALSNHCHQPAELLGRINQVLYRDLSAVNMFITAQLVFVDHRRRRVVTAGAGHCPLTLISKGAEPIASLTTAGTPLGVLPDVRYRQTTATLGRPGGVFLHTDGLIEARNAAGEFYGHDRLMKWLRDHCRLPCPAEHLRNQLAAELHRFRGDAPMADDQAFLILTETQPAKRIRNGSGTRVGLRSPALAASL